MPARKKKPTTTALANVEAEAAAAAANITDQLASGGGNWIKTKAKQFTLPDGTSNSEMTAVIIAFRTSQRYFPEDYVEGERQQPDCFAIGENPNKLVPSVNGPDKQADTCSECWAFQFESGKGKSKACRTTRNVALLPPTSKPNQEFLLLSVSPTALARFDNYVRAVTKTSGYGPIAVITTFKFDPDVDYSSIMLGEPVPNPKWKEMWPRVAEAVEILEREPDVAPKEAAKPVAKKKKVVRRKR